jgi:hypothetical protein
LNVKTGIVGTLEVARSAICFVRQHIPTHTVIATQLSCTTCGKTTPIGTLAIAAYLIFSAEISTFSAVIWIIHHIRADFFSSKYAASVVSFGAKSSTTFAIATDFSNFITHSGWFAYCSTISAIFDINQCVFALTSTAFLIGFAWSKAIDTFVADDLTISSIC